MSRILFVVVNGKACCDGSLGLGLQVGHAEACGMLGVLPSSCCGSRDYGVVGAGERTLVIAEDQARRSQEDVGT